MENEILGQEPIDSVETSVDARLDAIEQNVDTKQTSFFSPLIYLYNPSKFVENAVKEDYVFKPIMFVLIFSFLSSIIQVLFFRYMLQGFGSSMASIYDGIGIVLAALGVSTMLSLYWVPALLVLSAIINVVIKLFKKEAVYSHTFNLMVYPLVIFLIISSLQIIPFVSLGAFIILCVYQLYNLSKAYELNAGAIFIVLLILSLQFLITSRFML